MPGWATENIRKAGPAMLQYIEKIENKGILGIMRRACNYVDPRLMNHGFRTAYVVSKIVKRMGNYGEKQMRDICILTMMHDIGAYKTEEISRMLQFETENVWEHSNYGYLFIKYFTPLTHLAPAVLFHHMPYVQLKTMEEVSDEILVLSQILNIADRTDVYMEEEEHGWEDFAEELRKGKQTKFAPWLVELVLKDPIQYPIEQTAMEDEEFKYLLSSLPFTQEEVKEYLKMVICTIDFRSRHTVTHTMTTTSISYEMALCMGMAEEEITNIVRGALLHDLGKIGIPVEILEYPGKLSPQAMNIMRNHVTITEVILGTDVDETTKRIALRHHEKLDGSGYPRKLTGKDLTKGERIVAVADIVSALIGTRSYKEAYPRERVVGIIRKMRDDGLVDRESVDCIEANYGKIIENTLIRCQPILDAYHNIQKEYLELAAFFQKIEM